VNAEADVKGRVVRFTNFNARTGIILLTVFFLLLWLV